MFQSVSKRRKFRVRNSRSFSSGRDLKVIPSRISRRDPPREATLNCNVISNQNQNRVSLNLHLFENQERGQSALPPFREFADPRRTPSYKPCQEHSALS